MPQSVSDQDPSRSNHVGRAGATQGTPLPPSVEKAYYRKCIELKRRINEVEEANDVFRLRKARINRAILKMRLERAFLLDQLQQRMDHNIDESDRSTSPPPTPQDKPLRSKRSHRKNTPPLPGGNSPSHASPSSTQPPTVAMQRISSTQSNADGPLPPTTLFSIPTGSVSVNGSAATGASQALASVQPTQSQSTQSADHREERRPGHGRQDAAEHGDQSHSHEDGGAKEASGHALDGPARQNGEKRDGSDTEMRDAPPAPADFPGGFTAVNR